MPTNDYSKNIVYLSKEQYQELITNETLTVNGQTIIYNDNDIYVTPQAEPVTDVRVNGTSVNNNGIVNIPVASYGKLGLIQLESEAFGLQINNSGRLATSPADITGIKASTSTNKPIVPIHQHESVFYGLAKASGDTTQSQSSNFVGQYTDEAKQKIQNMLGITDLISTEEVSTATAAHALNATFMMNGKLHRAIAAIAIGDAVEVGMNCEVVKADEVFPHDVQVNGTSVMTNGVANVPVASDSTLGAVKVGGYGMGINGSGSLYLNGANEIQIKAGAYGYGAITALHQHESIFYGLSKVAGVDLANETVTLGTYPETSKTAIRSLIGAAAASDVTVSDVQVNGTSVLSGGVANVPVGSVSALGVIRVGSNAAGGLEIETGTNAGTLKLAGATIGMIKEGSHSYRPIVPSHQHESVFYGLAKASGDATQAASDNAVGTYTESAKASIRTMLGAASTNIVAIQDEQPTDTDTKVWLPGTQATGVEVPTYAEFTAGLAEKVGFTDYATSSTAGVMKVNDKGVKIENGELAIRGAGSSAMKAGTNDASVITPWGQHQAAFYGLAKAAGADLASAENITVGTYPTTASAAIRNMIGAVGKGDYATNGTVGLIKIGGGLEVTSSGALYTYRARSNQIKAGTSENDVIVPYNQHEAAFYGLAKAAGDTTMVSSSNAVGTYTPEAKSAIQSMLGIDLQSIASEVEIPLVETVSGTTPTITGQPNTRYVCGEVSTLSITPPAAGSIDVIFDSGSTPTVITVPNTVRWPAWFDVTALEADTTYEILITDGVYGSVMTWAN